MAKGRAEVMRYGIGKCFQFLIAGLKLSGSFSKFLVERANLMLAPMALSDIVVGFQNRNCLPLLVSTQRPPAGHHHAASICLGVLNLAFPAAADQQLRLDVV